MKKIYFLLLPALILGLGWAIRGHFGHEWGASWAGAMGALAIVLVARRADWTRNAPKLAALGAAGWAVGGMMSYGRVIGYCRGTDFWNVAYGFAMLAVIGALYGFIGGGFLGLGLETGERKKPEWAALITQMVAGAWLFWGFLIYQLEWFMTPPRSELWAACLGAAVALAWYLYRKGFHRALRVAGYAALGAGFGFAFGNFIQVLGSAGGLTYNWWNVMEFTLGFCGGLGMAYAVRTRAWPENAPPSRSGNWLALLFVFLFIPFINFVNAFELEKLTRLAEQVGVEDAAAFVTAQRTWGWLVMAVFAIATAVFWRRNRRGGRYVAPFLLFSISLYYLLFGYLVKGFFHRPYSFGSSDTLYAPILLIVAFLWFSQKERTEAWPGRQGKKENWRQWSILLGILLLVILLIAAIAIQVHDGLGGMHERF